MTAAAAIAQPAAAGPAKVWIVVRGKEIPDWILTRMTTGDVADDGSFEIECTDGVMRAEVGNAIFELNGDFYACPPRAMTDKIAEISLRHPSLAGAAKMAEQAKLNKAKSKMAADRAALRIKPAIGTPAAPQFVSVDQLTVDDTYQRSIDGGSSQKLISKIAVSWDWRLCLPLLVSRRKGVLYVIDGQHRLEAALLRGDIPHLPVVVFDFDDPAAEAELFVQANRSRRAMSKLDDFHAAVVAGDAKAVAVHEVVTSVGLQIGRIQAWQHWKPGEVIFVTAIQRAINSHGRELVTQALSVIAAAFEGQVLTGVGAIFEALCTFIPQRAKEGRPVDPELLQFVLAETGIPGWKEAVEGVDSGFERAEAMIKALTCAYEEAEAE